MEIFQIQFSPNGPPPSILPSDVPSGHHVSVKMKQPLTKSSSFCTSLREGHRLVCSSLFEGLPPNGLTRSDIIKLVVVTSC